MLDIENDSTDYGIDDGESELRVRLKLFVNESTWIERLRFYFVVNQKTSLRIRLFNFLVKILTVGLYLFRAIYDDPQTTSCCNKCTRNWTRGTKNPSWENQYTFSWDAIIWVDRPSEVWIMQVVLALICFIHALTAITVNYKGNLLQNIFTMNNLLEFVCTAPFISSLFWTELRCLFVPVFLNIWLANSGLNDMMNDLQRVTQKQKSAMFNQMCVLLCTILSLLITCISAVEQFERAGEFRLDFFDATWFVIVTFSTVGYGDITPSIWPSRVAIMVTIVVALSVLPAKIEDIAHLWSQQQQQGGEYSRQRAATEKHVIVCATELRLDVTMDFLNEFYAHPLFQKHYVVLLSPTDPDGALKDFLQIPIWTERVIFLRGSALRESDLLRSKLDAAEACFILTSRLEPDREAADHKTILRAMACKEHAPNCPLYVQILKSESKFHIPFADQVICDEEFKYALLAMNCYIPGLSTLITMLSHTSKGREGRSSKFQWKRSVGRSAGNEIYHVVAEDSKFFGEYVGYRFSHVSQLAHAKFGATLFGMRRGDEIIINPGLSRVIEKEDVLFYICIAGEENAIIVTDKERDGQIANLARAVVKSAEKELPEEEAVRNRSFTYNRIRPRLSSHESSCTNASQFESSEEWGINPDESHPTSVAIGFPPIFPYLGHETPTLCHILKERTMFCCLRHDRKCIHERKYENGNDPIVVCAEYATQSLINVMIPFRAHYRPFVRLNPVVFILEHSPENEFLEAISCFPMVSFMLGSMESLDVLLVAGIIRAHAVIIIDRLSSSCAEEEYMADARQLVAAQSIFKLFPTVRTCLELTHASNMRFNRFVSPNESILGEDPHQKKHRERSCALPYLFSESFASGEVFCSSMLDSLLYQSMVKDYLMTLLRLLLGLQYGDGSGHLVAHTVSNFEENRKYSSLFKDISHKTGGIILGIFRKEVIKVQQLEINDIFSAAEVKSHDEISEDMLNPKKRRNSSYGFSVKRSLKTTFNMMSSRKSNNYSSVRRLQMQESSMSEREKLDRIIRDRMISLSLPLEASPQFKQISNRNTKKFSYVMLNPLPDTIVKRGDILFIIEPEARSFDSSDTIAEVNRTSSIEKVKEETTSV